MKRLNVSLVGGLVVLMAGCASTPVSTPVAAPIAAARATPPVTHDTHTLAPRISPPSIVQANTLKNSPAYLDPTNPLSREKSVFFDFNAYTIKPQYTTVIGDNSGYLDQHHEQHVRIEGNADERGSREYNLALGNKRADAVAAALKAHGVTDSQLEIISYGKEKPRATGHDEADWSQNRRADIDYLP